MSAIVSGWSVSDEMFLTVIFWGWRGGGGFTDDGEGET
jgi:hypothetical protein